MSSGSRVHTDAGVIGLGETFYGAGAVEAHIHDTLAGRLLGRNPLHIEAIHRDMLNLPMAQSSTGVEYRAASAIDIALWDLFGKVCGQPVHQMLGGLCRPKQRIYNTCAGYGYVRSTNIKPVSTWNFSDAAGPYEDLNGFMTRADAVAESLLESRHHRHEDLAVRSGGAGKRWHVHHAGRSLKAALEPFEKIRRAVGDKMEIMVEFHCLWNLPMAKQLAKALEPYKPTWFEDPIRMNSPQALAEYARSTTVWVCASETLGSRFPYKDMLDRDAMHVVMADLCWTGGLTEGRKIAAMAETYHRPFAPHDCVGPVGFIAGDPRLVQPAQHADPGERARLLYRLVQGTRHHHAGDRGRLRAADGGPGPGHGAVARGIRATRPHRSPVGGIGADEASSIVRSDRPHRAGHGILARPRTRDGRGAGRSRRCGSAERG